MNMISLEKLKETVLEASELMACAPELCYLAMGRCELYFEYLLSPWDFTAASLILTEAGGVIAGLNGETPDFVSPSGIIAANNEDNLKILSDIVKKHTVQK